MHRVRSLSVFLAWLTVACSAVQLFDRSSVETELFGTMPDGTHVEIVRLTNANGVEVRGMTYGAIIVSIRVPDREGTLDDVVLGFDDLDQYVQGHPQFGTVVGRYANRIAGGQFTLDNQTYTLARNNGPNHLHGGIQGFDKMLWQAETGQTDRGVRVTFTHTCLLYTSPSPRD